MLGSGLQRADADGHLVDAQSVCPPDVRHGGDVGSEDLLLGGGGAGWGGYEHGGSQNIDPLQESLCRKCITTSNDGRFRRDSRILGVSEVVRTANKRRQRAAGESARPGPRLGLCADEHRPDH